MRRENTIANMDWLTVLMYLLLVFFGWLSIYSASSDEEVVNVFDFSQRYGKQIVWIGLALLLAVVILIIDAQFFSAFSYIIYFSILLLLMAVLLFGKTVAGSKSWIDLGSLSIQPAEFAKFATALALYRYLSSINTNIQRLKTKLVSVVIITLPALLILLQNDTGSALVYAAFVLVLYREGISGAFIVVGVFAALLFILTLLFGEVWVSAGVTVIAVLLFALFKKMRKRIKPLLAGMLFSIVFVFSVNYAYENVLATHQKKRINVMLGIEKDPSGAGYNVNQSKIAIGSGGLKGKGFRKGMLTRYHFVPEQTTDFIFCTVGEEWGFAGTSTIILLFVFFLIRLIVLAERQKSHFSRIYGYAVASIFFFHFAVNIGMTIGLAPVVGIPLPFFSYGGSSLWAFTILLFIFIKQDANRLNLL